MHHFKYAFKALIRSKTLVFWVLVFPLVLGTLFKLTIGNIAEAETFSAIPIAVVGEGSDFYEEALSGMDDLLDVQFTTEAEAVQLLENGDIDGFVRLGDSLTVVVAENGINQTILAQVMGQLARMEALVETAIATNLPAAMMADPTADPEVLGQEIAMSALQTYEDAPAVLRDQTNENMDWLMVEFYTLIAMACMYGGMLGIKTLSVIMADMGPVGMRVSVGPKRKLSLLVGSGLAAFAVQMVGLVLLFVFCIYVLGANFGDSPLRVLGISVAGSLAGLFFGLVAGCFLRGKTEVKTNILTGIVMIGCFLAGMMGVTMKYVVDTNAPLVNALNPVNMITDGLYALYFFEDMARFNRNLWSLVLFSGLMLILCVGKLRRTTYDHL